MPRLFESIFRAERYSGLKKRKQNTVAFKVVDFLVILGEM